MESYSMLKRLFSPTKENHFYKTLSILLEMGIQNVAADEGSLLLYRQAEGDLEFKIVVGNKSRNLLGQTVPMGEGITGNAALTRETLIGSRNASNRMFDVKNDGHPFSVMASPVFLGEDVIGVITAVKFSKKSIFQSSDSYRYDMLSYVVSKFINSQLELANLKNMKQKTQKLSTSQQQIVLRTQSLIEKFPEKGNEFDVLLSAVEKLLE